MFCQSCGVEAPTKYIAFYQNIGALIMRFTSSVEGNLCKSCVHKTFWKSTGINLLLGWWGVISFIVTPFFIINNVVRYLLCLGMEPVPPGATQPELNEAALAKLQPHTDYLVDQLNSGEEFERVVEAVSMRAGVSPGQVALYVHILIASSQESTE